MTKYDFLVTEVQDKIAETVRLLQEYGEIETDLTLREVYNKYLHPEVLPHGDENLWKSLHENNVLNVFQFDSDVGSQAAKKIKPNSILEMADANGLMRLMTSEKGQETPMEKYVRYKNNIQLWYNEMKREGLTEEEQKIVEPYFLQSYGVPPSQEQLMKMLMDKDICGFTLAEANDARKIVGKKQMSRIPELREKVLEKASSPCLGRYIWTYGIGPQMGYSFSIIHALAYSFIGFQTIFIANRWNPIYWNTACLIVNSGALEDNLNTDKEKATDYAKIANAIGDIISRGIEISLVDINKSNYGFEPDVENNQILYGLKALSNISSATIEQIKAGRPYQSIVDFMNRCPLNKTAMISLIKAGAFDNTDASWAFECNQEPRIAIMAYYLSKVSEPKKRLTLQNFNGLLERGLVPDSLDKQKRTFNFNKHLKTYQKVGKYYVFDNICYDFYRKYFDEEELEVINGNICILQTKWEKIYKKVMEEARTWLQANQEEMLNEFNYLLFKETWDKYATGSISAWEMESLCFYYHEHELAHVDTQRYGIVDFFDLPEQPQVDYFFKRNGRDIPIFKTYKIMGTVISKDDNHSTVSILTLNGVVTVKFTKEYYAMFGRQLSEKQADGSKKVVEKGWFKRGTKLMFTGFRRDDMFVTKTYKHTSTHQIYKITDVYEDGQINITHDRYTGEEE